MARGVPGNGSRPRFGAGRLRRPAEQEPVAVSFGEALRQARRARDLSLQDAERDTRIPQRYLAALEDQEYGPLPSTVYARGVLRAYASYLDLDPEPLLEQFRPPRAREERNPIRPAVPLAGAGSIVSWSTLGSLLLAALALAGMVALGAYLYGQYVALNDSLQAPEPRSARGGLDVPDPLVAPWTPLPRPTPSPLPTATMPPEDPAAQAAAEAPTPNGGTPAATPSPAPTAAATATPRPSAAVTVEARVVERSWLQVWSDGRQVFAETVAPGTTRTFTASDSLQMRVGNAGGVQVVVNGEPQGRLGASGQAVDVSWGRR
jgi:cytoskeleton protein RodZ